MGSTATTPALLAWLTDQLARGCTPASLMQAMLEGGWDLPHATEALWRVATGPLDERAVSGLTLALQRPAASPSLAHATRRLPDLQGHGAHQLRVADHDVRVVLDLAQPRVVVVADLLTPAECEDLIAAARGRLQRSQTVSALSSSTAEVNVARTSEGMFFHVGEHEVVTRLEQRIAALFNWPVAQAEGLQVLRYSPGAQYRPHFDHFDKGSPGGQAATGRGGQRVGTVVVYLATPQAGGATVFPDLGLQVHAHAGHAVFFNYDVDAGGPGVLHGGAEVAAGEKWVATKWLRENKFE